MSGDRDSATRDNIVFVCKDGSGGLASVDRAIRCWIPGILRFEIFDSADVILMTAASNWCEQRNA